MPSTRAQAAQRHVTSTNPENPGTLWLSRRDPRAGDDKTTSTSKPRRSNKRERSPSPEPPTPSATSSTTNKRRRSNRLQAAKAEKEKAVIKLHSAPLAAPQARGPTRGRSTTAKAPARGQAVRSRKKKEAPHGLTQRHSQRLASSRGEEIAPPDHDSPDSEQGENVTQEPLSARQSNSPSPERSRTTLVNFDPEVREYIDFGSLVPEPRTRSRKSIDLKFVDDGPRETTLTVGRSQACDVQLEGDDIGDVHCSIELLLLPNHGNYQRVVRVHLTEPHSSTIVTPQPDDASQLQVTLREGCSIGFGTKNKHRYHFVPAQQPLPDPPCWATRVFTWSPEAKPDFGGSKRNCSVYLVRKRSSNSRHAIKIIPKVKFSFNSALQQMVRRERQALSLFGHPNVLQLQHFRQDDVHSRIIFVFPEMRGGNLLDFVVKNRRNQLSINKIAPKLAEQLLSGLEHIHSKDIVHRDIKPDNLLLAEDVPAGTHDPIKVVIGDFGIARLPGEQITEPYLSGSLHWISPLSFRDPEKAEYDFAIDLWGVALIIWFMIAGTPKPWGEVGEPKDPHEINQLPWDRLGDFNISNDCMEFLRGFLVEQPEQCRTIGQTKSHSWILNGNTVNPIGQENHGAMVDDSGVSQEQKTQVSFGDESYMPYHY